MNIFNYIPLQEDPVFLALRNMRLNNAIQITHEHGDFTVLINGFGFYELEDNDTHESFTRLEDCYAYINQALSRQQLGILGGI